MPKPSNSKKRKRDKKKDEGRGAKRVKSKDIDAVGEDLSDHNADLSGKADRELDDIDEILEENATKNNLTAINVKSILHHVVSDKRVLAMVKNAAAESDDDEMSDGCELDYAPKMTRAKSKQTNQGDPIAVLASQSPIKELKTKQSARNKRINFTELELPESSSDEEYNPDNEEDASDEDTESCVSFTSDLASPHIPGTPEGHKTDDIKESEHQTESPKSVTRSCTKKLLEETFKIPFPVTSNASAPVEQVTVVEEGDLIAKRTRSQLPLQDVPIETIEATFQPPDFTADMYDSIPVDDMDFEDIEWQKWLQGLVNSDVCVEEDHEDTEYNFMAEANQKEEKEEYRNDRAVRISQKELNELLEELLKDYDDNEGAMGLDEEGDAMGYLDMLNSSRSGDQEKIQLFNSQQLERLNEQLQQHTQLLTQIYLMAREDDSLVKEAELSRDYVIELKGFQERASNAQLIRGLGDGMVHASAFSFPSLEQAVEMVNSSYVRRRRTPSPRKCTTPKKDPKPPAKASRRTKRSDDELLPSLSDTNQQLMANNKSVFQFVELLPHHNLLPRTGDTPKQLNGLRVKFSEAEDNLLALGMKQLGKKWELIQEHLLPVKSPKQLQIRCKNLLSARAPENIIKYYRRNKELWKLPTKIQVSSESGGRLLRGKESVEPLWLRDYKKRQKERRESQEKSEALAVQQAIDGAAYGRPIAPKLSGPTCAVALPSAAANGERATVTWVTITSTTSPWKAVTTPQPVEVMRETETTQNTGNLKSTIMSPVSSDHQECSNVANENHSPVKVPSDLEPASEIDVDSSHSPANEEPVIQVEEKQDISESSVSTTDDDPKSSESAARETEGNKETAPKDSAEKTALESSTNKPASKPKPSRDKNGGNVTNASGTSRKPAPNSQAGWVGNYILEPDPKFRNRAQAFAEGYLAKVTKQLSGDPETFEEFLRILAMSSEEQCSPVELYRRVEVVLAEYPGLVEGFVGFLEPHQAVEAGVFMENQEFVRARTFLRKLEVHFQRSPSQFRKIINAFHSWNKKAVKDPLELRQTIVPMLKGQLHLIEELYSFFDDTKPPVCSDDDFEEVEFGSGSEPEVDDFEEVVIPCFVEPKKIKGRPAKDTQKNNSRKAKKPCSSVKGAKQQGSVSKPLGNRTKTKSDLSKPNGKPETLQGRGQRENTGINTQANTGVAGEESGLHDQRTEVTPLDEPLSAAASLHSETSNDSCREELNPTSVDTSEMEHEGSERRNSDSEEQEDDGNSDNEHDGYEEEDDDEYMEGDPAEYTEDNDLERTDMDTEASGCDSDANTGSAGAVPAKNLQRSQDGRVVLLWTREDDRTILQACQKMGPKMETFQHIANSLENKTADEVKQRFMDLLNLYKASGGEKTESKSEDSCSDEEDEDDSETIGESEGEQCHDQ